MSHSAQKVKISRDETRWEVEVKAEIPADVLARYREQELKELQKTAKLDGFRPAKLPSSASYPRTVNRPYRDWSPNAPCAKNCR